MPTLEDAINLAIQAHKGHVDKTGQPYIMHVLRVMFRMESERDMIIGVLHDLIEDTPYTVEDLRKMGYPEDILEALDSLSKRENEAYEEYISRVMKNPAAVPIKKADLDDHMDIHRFPYLTEKDIKRLRRYMKAMLKLTELP